MAPLAKGMPCCQRSDRLMRQSRLWRSVGIERRRLPRGLHHRKVRKNVNRILARSPSSEHVCKLHGTRHFPRKMHVDEVMRLKTPLHQTTNIRRRWSCTFETQGYHSSEGRVPAPSLQYPAQATSCRISTGRSFCRRETFSNAKLASYMNW